MNIWDYADQNACSFFWLSLLLVPCVTWVATGVLKLVIFILPNRIMRHFNIWKHGWPPEHCDADGDFE